MKILFFKEGKPMSKKKKIFILISMVVLLVVTGYLNIALNKSGGELQTSTTTANFFTTCRADKLATRNYLFEIYDKTISTSTNPDEVARAREAKDLLSARIDEELILETKITSSGYEDAVVNTIDDVLYVYVKTPNGITGDEIASILAVIVGETNLPATNIKITPVA